MALINSLTTKPKLNVSNIKSPFGSGASIPKISAGAHPQIRRPSVPIKPAKFFDAGTISQIRTNVSVADNLSRHDSDINSIAGQLAEINAVMQDIGGALALDFANRITEQKRDNKNLKDQVKLNRRSLAETSVESGKKIGKGIGSGITGLASKTGSALGLGNIFDAIKLLGLGIAANAIIPNLEKIFDFVEKNFNTILLVGGALVGLKLLSAFGGLLAFGSLLTNPLFLVAVGTVLSMASQGLGRNEKRVLKELEAMGGPTLENRKKLIAEKQNLIDTKYTNFTWATDRSRAESDIRFLRDGTMSGSSKQFNFDVGLPFDYNMGPNRGKFDFDQEKFDKGILNLSQKPKVNLIEMDLPPITVPSNKTAKNISLPETTQVPYASSVNLANKHMTKTPEIHGIIG